MRAAVSARSVPCRPVRICSHLFLPNIVILNDINGDREVPLKKLRDKTQQFSEFFKQCITILRSLSDDCSPFVYQIG